MSNLLPHSIFAYSMLYEPVNPTLAAMFVFFRQAFHSFCLFSLLEMSCISFLVLHIWKRTPPINEDFFLTFLGVLNVTLATLLGATDVLFKRYWYYVVQSLPPTPESFRASASTITIFGSIIAIVLNIVNVALNKMKKVNAVHPIPVNSGIYNNVAKNGEVLTIKHIYHISVAAVLVTIATVVHKMVQRIYKEENQDNLYALYYLIVAVIVSAFTPCFALYKIKNMRIFVADLLKRPRAVLFYD